MATFQFFNHTASLISENQISGSDVYKVAFLNTSGVFLPVGVA